MSTPLKIPDVGESIQEVQIGQWLKSQGDQVEVDENVVELETDKASMVLPAPISGTLSKILKQEGDLVSVGETIAYIEGSSGNGKTQAETMSDADASSPEGESDTSDAQVKETTSEREASTNAKASHDGDNDVDQGGVEAISKLTDSESIPVTPSGRRALRKYGLTAEQIEPRGKRIRRDDVERYVSQRDRPRKAEGGESEVERETSEGKGRSEDDRKQPVSNELEELVPMSLIRRRIAERLVEAQQKAALLTTFNQIDMSQVMDLRKRYQAKFKERYEIKLGFMSFFVKAAVEALKQFPEVNAEIRGTDLLYRNYFHVGIAIGSDKGLVVPVLRHAERMSFADIEKAIADFARRANSNKINPDELMGGTFTISNGGIYGSLLSTPIVNPPQSAVLGMHAIEERPIARDGQVVIRPMMYVALTYDHRIIDGAEAVTFLKRIKEAIEEPARMLMEV